MRENVATGNAIGLYIGDSPQARADISRNEVFGNGEFGLFLRNTAIGTVTRNSIHGNCVGDLHPERRRHHAPRLGDPSQLDRPQQRALSRADGGISGVGIVIFGGDDNVIRGNDIIRNRPSGDVGYSGGVVLLESFDGSTSDGNIVIGNTIDPEPSQRVRRTAPGHGNRIAGNDCTGPC